MRPEVCLAFECHPYKTKQHIGTRHVSQQSACLRRDEAQNAQLLSLDVGGTVYTAARQTLAAVPDSWFARLLAGEIQLPRTAQDARFVDRDGQVRPKSVHRAVTAAVAALASM